MPRFCTRPRMEVPLSFFAFSSTGIRPGVLEDHPEREEVAPSVESVPSFKWRFLMCVKKDSLPPPISLLPSSRVYKRGGIFSVRSLAACRERTHELVGCLTLPREKDRKLPGHFDLMRRSIWPPLCRRSPAGWTWLRVYGQEFWYFVKRRERGIYYG